MSITQSLFQKGHYLFPEGNALATHGGRPRDLSGPACTYLAKLEHIAGGAARSL